MHQIGETIQKRYYLLGVLGEGGSGITYHAKDIKNKENVALKALSLKYLQDWKALDRFEREAKILEQLEHPAIPRYLDYFQIDRSGDRHFYIVQELAPGQSLESLVAGGWQTSEREVKEIAKQILEILVYLHELSPPVIHRDIKPQNLIRREDGKIFLVDFGAVQQTYQSTLARSSTVVGTFGYMAPEQFIGQAVPATDLYGLGATLLFILTHRSPADFPTERLKLNFRDRLSVAPEFGIWLEKLLEPDLGDRFSHPRQALKALLNPKIQTARSSVFKRRKNRAILVLGITTILICGYIFRYTLLSSLGFTPEPFYKAILDGNTEKVQYYLERGIRVNTRDMLSSSPLHWSVTNQHPDIVRLLIQYGAKLEDTYSRDDHRVLHIAVQHQIPETTQLLLEQGADINARDNLGRTPLHSAIYKPDVRNSFYYGMQNIPREPSLNTIALLLQNGADVNARDLKNMTPLDYALQVDAKKVENLLRSYGAE
ncbi:MAG: ankyrin repeat domain-containing protein [Cyanobacteria bacterium SBLK]|nr:ankyrin repeat domain-containing protein [Cyanobacteria bacterium SBLK]